MTKRRAKMRTFLLSLWSKKRTLWLEPVLDQMESEIRDDVEKDMGAIRRSTRAPGDVMLAEETKPEVTEQYYAHTLEEIGKELDLSKEAVRQIELGALHKMRMAFARLETP